MASHFIVMGDIRQSRRYDGKGLMDEFKALIASCNKTLAEGFLSPYTITLGDEFQGIAKSLHWAVKSLLHLEEWLVKRGFPFDVKYVVHYGGIDTTLNRKVAHGMVGPGLTHARELLTDKRRGRPPCLFDLPNASLALQLTNLFTVMGSLKQDWQGKDADLIFDMLASDDNAAIGAKHGKNRSQIWKRRRHLHIADYKALRAVATEISQGRDRQ